MNEISDLKYTLIYIIHGDDSYLYHDTKGNSKNADEMKLEEALFVAGNLKLAEVFIYHLKRKKRLFYLFPQKDGDFYYFRNGRLYAKTSYSRDHSVANFNKELELYKLYSHSKPSSQTKKYLLYYGHEIPIFSKKNYHSSYPDVEFSVNHASHIMSRFLTNPTEKFELLVLSTCYSGNPIVIFELSSLSKYIIASPEELHLSFMDSDILVGILKNNLPDSYSLAHQFARSAYEKLVRRTQTIVTVALYETGKISQWLDPIFDPNCQLYKFNDSISSYSVEFYDCRENPEDCQLKADGVDIFYRPPKFGKLKDKRIHSGWECMRLIKCSKSEIIDN